MRAELKKLNLCVDEFGEEIHGKHIAYINNKDGAKERATEIINDIIENGLETTVVSGWPSLRMKEKVSYKKLCETYTHIFLTYHFNLFCGGELRWILEN